MTLLLLEIWGFLQVPVVWWLFHRYARRNVAGEMLAGAVVGVFWEISTEPLWDYHFVVTVYKDIPPGIVLGWGVLFTLAVFVSEKLYTLIFRRNSIIEYDKRIFITDLLAAPLVGLPLEKTGMLAGVWDYHYELLNWSGIVVPVFGMPLEALIGYGLLMLTGPTFVRYWQRGFERR